MRNPFRRNRVSKVDRQLMEDVAAIRAAVPWDLAAGTTTANAMTLGIYSGGFFLWPKPAYEIPLFGQELDLVESPVTKAHT